MHQRNDGGGGMKWLIWCPALAILFLAAAFPGGLVLLALPLLALGEARRSTSEGRPAYEPKES
jgi:hypothetical protein